MFNSIWVRACKLLDKQINCIYKCFLRQWFEWLGMTWTVIRKAWMSHSNSNRNWNPPSSLPHFAKSGYAIPCTQFLLDSWASFGQQSRLAMHALHFRPYGRDESTYTTYTQIQARTTAHPSIFFPFLPYIRTHTCTWENTLNAAYFHASHKKHVPRKHSEIHVP
jgi:hypothetical protein